MAGADLTSLSNVLKDFYLPPLQDQMNQDVMVTQLLKVDSENLEGLRAVVPLHYGRSAGIGSRAELGTLPSAGAQKYDRATFDLKYHYARVQVSGPSIQRTNSERGAFLQALKSELDFIRNDLQLDQARQYYGDGTGVIATVATSGVSGSVVTLTSAEPIFKGYLYVGMTVDFVTGSTVHRSTTITDVNAATPSITVAVATTIADADKVVRTSNVTDVTDISTNAEINAGLMRMVGSATAVVGGVDPAATGKSFWAPSVTSWTSDPDLNLDKLMVKSNELQNAGGRQDQVVVMTTPGIVRRLFQSTDFKDGIRFVNSTTLKGGFEELSFSAGNGPMKINSDRLAPWGTVLLVDKAQIKVFSPADWDFLSRDGLTIRWVSDQDAFQAILFKYSNLGTGRRNTSGALTNLTDTGV